MPMNYDEASRYRRFKRIHFKKPFQQQSWSIILRTRCASRAYDYFVQALSIFEDINDPSGLAYTYQSLARLYKSQRDYIKAENNYLKANKIRLSLGNTGTSHLRIFRPEDYTKKENNLKRHCFLHRADSAASLFRMRSTLPK